MVAAVVQPNESRWNLCCRWRGRCYNIPLTVSELQQASWADLKQLLYEQLCVPVDRQKFLGVSFRGSRVRIDDDALLVDVTFSGVNDKSFTLVGTPEEEQLPDEVAHAASAQSPDYNSVEAQKLAAKANNCAAMRNQLERILTELNIIFIRQPRPNRKLLVLDIDYTIYDCKGASLGYAMDDLKRPYLDFFLTAIWPHYDYVIWSQTRWQWIEMKCTELGLLTEPSMGPCFTLDKYAMLSWDLSERAQADRKSKHNVKSLQIVWRKFPKLYGPHNTLHVDDLPRNFRMNPSNGILVKPYLRENRQSDRELLTLGHYLVACAQLADVRDWDHSKWKEADVCRAAR